MISNFNYRILKSLHCLDIDSGVDVLHFSDVLKCNWLQYGNNDDCKMEEAILGRGDGQMGLSCLFKALSSLFCCQLEFVLYVLIR